MTRIRKGWALPATAVVASLVLEIPVYGAIGVQNSQTLAASDARASEYFGDDVSISGDVILVGAHACCGPGHENQPGPGSAYVFRNTGGVWSEEQKLAPAAGRQNELFGWSVSVDGDVLAVGARAMDGHNAPGAVYVFRRVGGSWTQEQMVTDPDGISPDYFGEGVVIRGDLLVVGSPSYEENEAEPSGAAYIYRLTGNLWMLEQTLTASDASPGSSFGFSVSSDGEVALVGSAYNDENGDSAGAAYVFRFVGGEWMEEQKLLASDGNAGDWFGWSTAVKGDAALVGARRSDTPGTGSAYAFRYNGGVWEETQKLTRSDSESHFASAERSVSLSDGVALIASYGWKDPSTNGGYLYRDIDGLWVEVQKLSANSGIGVNGFSGRGFALAGDQAVIGYAFDDDQGIGTGSVIVFSNLSTAADRETAVPSTITLARSYPNPFETSTTIRYELNDAQHVRLEVFDMLGRSIGRLVDAVQIAGKHEVPFDGRGLPSGPYVYRIQSGGASASRMMVLQR